MNLEMKVTNLEISKKLKEMGIKKDSIFWWMQRTDGSKFISSAYGCNCWVELPYNNENFCNAYTASELIDMLPHMVDTKINEPFNGYRLWIGKSFIVESLSFMKTDIYIVNYKCDSTECAGEDAWLQRQLTSSIHSENLANALALMLIYLIENKLYVL